MSLLGQAILTRASMKACLVKDGIFSCPFLRPSKAGVEISSAGVASFRLRVYYKS